MTCPRCGATVNQKTQLCPECNYPAGDTVQPSNGHPPQQTSFHPHLLSQLQPQRESSQITLMIPLVVIIVIVVIISLLYLDWLYVSGRLFSSEEEIVVIELLDPSMEQQSIGDETYWDVTCQVNRITPSDSKVSWESVRVGVFKGPYRDVLIVMTPFEPDDPSVYDDGTDGVVDVQLWYLDMDGDGFIDRSDRFKITGLTENFEGATIEIDVVGDNIGSFLLPTNFE